MTPALPISRRTVLRGLGTAIALPWLEAMKPLASAAGDLPRRMAFFYVPNGVHLPDWTPEHFGSRNSHSPQHSSRSQPIEMICSY